MKKNESYAYFAFKGEGFNPDEITSRIGIKPTDNQWKQNKSSADSNVNHSSWMLCSTKESHKIYIDDLVNEVINKLYSKIDIINELKCEFDLQSVLEIVMYIDTDPEASTPALGHDLKTIEFLYRTQTTTDVDIYLYNHL
jgi:Domain of unknown function (DUF4279)